MNTIKLAWKNLTNKPLNMTLSLLLFALGVGMISIIFLVETQVREKFNKNLAGINIVLGAKGSPLQAILCNMYHIDSPNGNVKIQDVKAFLNPKHPLIETAIPLSIGDNYSNFRIVGTTHNYPKLYDVKVKEGKLWEKNFEVTIGADAARIGKLEIGSTFFSSHGLVSDGMSGHEHGQFKVVGIFEKSNSVIDQLILSNTESVWEVHDHEEGAHIEEEEENHDEHNHDDHSGHDHSDHDHSGHDHSGHDHAHHDHAEQPRKPLREYVDKEITSLLLTFKQAGSKGKRGVTAMTVARGINESTKVMAALPSIEIPKFYDNMSIGEKFLRNIALIIVFVSGLSIFISLFNSLRDRKYELALMRVMGASPTKLFFLIIIEGLLLAIIGYIIGIALSHLGMYIFSGQMQEKYHYAFTAARFLKEEGYLLIGALGVGFLAALIPAIQALRTDISETLTSS